MSAAIRFPRPGELVKFQDGDSVQVGRCNGEPLQLVPNTPWVLSHLPVYVHEGDRCLMVGVKNIIEWPEA
jgi:hypothetical protein